MLVKIPAGEGYSILAVVPIVCDRVTTPLHIFYPFLSQSRLATVLAPLIQFMENHRSQPPNELSRISSEDGETSASPPSAAGISLPVGSVTVMASIINPYARCASLRHSLCPSSPSEYPKLPSLQSVCFWLDNNGNKDCDFSNHDNSDKADYGGNDANDVCNNSSLSVDVLSNNVSN